MIVIPHPPTSIYHNATSFMSRTEMWTRRQNYHVNYTMENQCKIELLLNMNRPLTVKVPDLSYMVLSYFVPIYNTYYAKPAYKSPNQIHFVFSEHWLVIRTFSSLLNQNVFICDIKTMSKMVLSLANLWFLLTAIIVYKSHKSHKPLLEDGQDGA